LAPREPFEGKPVLRPRVEHQFRLSDFVDPNPTRRILVELALKAPVNHDESLEELLLELLERRMPTPYLLRERKTLEEKERSWGRVYVIYRKRLDRIRSTAKNQPRRGKIRADVEIVTHFPKGFGSNWDGFRYQFAFERPLDQLRQLDLDFWNSVRGLLPALVLSDETEAPPDLQLREELGHGDWPPLFEQPLLGLFPDGCAALRTDTGIELRRLRQSRSAVIRLDDGPSLAAHCTLNGAFVALPANNRSARVSFEPWESRGQRWNTQVSFSQGIETDLLRFILAQDVVCLLGEQRERGLRYAKLACFRQSTGALLWEWATDGSDVSAIDVRDERVIIATGRRIVELELHTGQTLWSAEIEDATGVSSSHANCVNGKSMIFSPRSNRYLAYDPKLRQSPWTFATLGSDFIYCDELDGIYLEQAGGSLIALERDSLTPRWRFHVGEQVVDLLSFGGSLFVLLPRAIYLLEPESGRIQWAAGLPFMALHLMTFERRIYARSADRVYELTRADRI
jgi:hypothetical protein